MSSSGSLSVVRRAGWLGPVVVTLVLVGIGWWLYGTVARATGDLLTADLTARVHADAGHVSSWLDQREREAVVVAQRTDGLAAILAQPHDAEPDVLRALPEQETLRDALRPPLEALGYDGFLALSASGRCVAASAAAEIGTHPLEDAAVAVRRALAGETLALPPRRGAHGPELPVLTPAGDGVLVLRMEGLGEFAALLGPGRVGQTGESYAFDANGLMLTPSRFDERLAGLGLVPSPGAAPDGPPGEAAPDAHPTAALNVDLRDPGGDLTQGFRSGAARRSLPLTRLAAAAVGGSPGVEVRPYRGYRGTPVVGAWEWLPAHQLGIATEMEASEAYGPLRNLTRAFLVLIGVLVLGGALGAYVAHRNASLRRKVREAEKEARQLGQYTLVKKIGAGAMGEVYYAKHAMLRRPCALKMIRPERASEHAIARFEREVQLTSQLTHPNTIQIYDYGRTPGGIFYYVMEYLVGISLEEFVQNEAFLPEGRVIHILQQMCSSLNEAHGKGLVHRDIKPANVALCRAGGEYDVVKVLDFGLVVEQGGSRDARLSQTGTITGTPMYMSPEALTRPSEVDARSDLYAVGAVGYFLLTGQPVFAGETAMDIFNQHLREKPVPPSQRVDREVLPDLELAILACLEKSPAKRPQSANALSRELDWCRSEGEWNAAKARHWWADNEERLERLYGLSAKERVMAASGEGSITLDVRERDLPARPGTGTL